MNSLFAPGGRPLRVTACLLLAAPLVGAGPCIAAEAAPWHAFVDECMTAGGSRNDCIEALPPELYRQLLEWESNNAEARRALLNRPRIPAVPPPAELPDIYRSPLGLPALRADVAADLAAQECLVPHDDRGRPNVVTAELAVAGQLDVAVICSAGGQSRIEIFWGGESRCPPLEDRRPDWSILHEGARWEYTWGIGRASPDEVRSYYERYPGECPAESLPRLDHDALVDISGEKASSNLYCHDGRWLELCGSD